MRRFRYNKLVRDKILDSMLEKKEKIEYHILSDQEYLVELKKKIVEEAGEIDLNNKEELKKELADLQEVLDCIIAAIGASPREIKNLQDEKNAKAGSFKNRVFIDTTELQEGNPWIKHLAASPDRYPEIK